ncbi:exonuclease SbcCD subunit D [Lacticaseibacillus yichunensis]|uniref:Nuclease SbcCD subunit D n=1 Tax=Lacticaseibacillus yichunensis TaxID=2486015 RepID=A0ABW4CQP3_9LACO|nr:exonuclease SbcCD subunit D [Lacticaseibacillus yichunensis]
MKIMHTADWHIGKKLNGFDLLEDQRAVFDELKSLAKQEHVDVIMLAGDVYDRALPSEEAVTLVDQMLFELNREMNLPLLVISGNHDSGVRLRTGREWFQSTGLYLNTRLEEAFSPVVLGDTQFFLLPFFQPVDARLYFKDETLTNIQKAIEPVVAKMQTLFDPTKRHVLIAHFFAAGSEHSDSETLVNVGGLDAVPVTALAPFDYVALGHLHNKDAVRAEKIQYAGSLLKFSVSEAHQEKGVFILDTETMARRFVPLAPLHELQTLTGPFADFLHATPGEYDRDAYTAITLTDTAVIPNVMAQLREVFPRVLTLARANGIEGEVVSETTSVKISPMAMLDTFFEQVTGDKLTPEQAEWAKQALAHTKGAE